MLTVSRVVVELPPRFHPGGGRFLARDYPQDQEHRQLKLSPQIVQKIAARIGQHSIGGDDLLFAMPELPQRPLRILTDPATLGLTTPNAAGRRYRHGTLSGYSGESAGASTARGAYAIYRAQRRTAGQDRPRGLRTVATDRLFLSSHTVSSHLYRSFPKLGVTATS